MKRNGLTVIDNDGNEIVHFSEDEIERLSEVVDATNNTLNSLEQDIAKQAMINYLTANLIEGYPENKGVCYVSDFDLNAYKDEQAIRYGLDDEVSDIIDRLRNKLASLVDEYEDLAARFDFFTVIFEEKSGGYKVIAIDEDRLKNKGVKWLADKLAKTPKEHREIRRKAKEWINRNTENI